MIFKYAQISDIDDILLLVKDFELYLNSLGSKDVVEYKMSVDSFKKYAFGANKSFNCLLVEDDGKNIGFLNFYFGFLPEHKIKIVHITDFFIKKLNRGHIFQIKKNLISFFKSENVDAIHWTVWKYNSRANNLYKLLGAKNYEEASGEITLFMEI